MTVERQLRLADAGDTGVKIPETAAQAIERIMCETRHQVSWHTPKPVRPDHSKVFDQADLERQMGWLPKGSKLYVLISPSNTPQYRLASDLKMGEGEEWNIRLPEGGTRAMRFISEANESSDPFIKEHGGKVFEIVKGEEVVISESYGTKTDWHIDLGNGLEPFRNLAAVERWGDPTNPTGPKVKNTPLE